MSDSRLIPRTAEKGPSEGRTSRPADGESGSEVKFVELVLKRPDISDERFVYHWKNIHGPQVKEMLEVIRYVQLHRVAPSLPGLPTIRFEGVVEAWFESMKTVEQAFVSPAYVELSGPDEKNFLEQDPETGATKIIITVTKEEILLAGEPDRPAGVKAVMCLRRRAGLDREEFKARWRQFSERLIEAARPTHFARSAATEAEYEDGQQPDFDGYDFIAFETLEALERNWESDRVRDLLAEMSQFADLTRCAGYVGAEYRVTWP